MVHHDSSGYASPHYFRKTLQLHDQISQILKLFICFVFLLSASVGVIMVLTMVCLLEE